MLVVVLDTNILVADFQWRSAHFRLLLGEKQRGQLQLAVPRLVVQEAANKYSERVAKAFGDARAANRNLHSLGYPAEISIPEADLHDVREDFERELVQRIQGVGGEMPDYPTVGHEDIVARILDERRPFKTEGKGYRDSLLWLSVVELARYRGQVALITQNSRDFAESSEGTSLHRHLLEDLEREAIPAEGVHLFPNLAAFVRAKIEPARKLLEEVELMLKQDEEFRLHVIEEIQTAIEGEFPPGSPVPVDSEPSPDNPYDDPTFAHIDIFSITDVVVDDARISGPDDAYLFLEVQVNAEIDAFLSKGDFYSLPDDENVGVMDPDWNDYYMWVHLERTADISLDAKYPRHERSVSDVHVIEARVKLLRS